MKYLEDMITFVRMSLFSNPSHPVHFWKLYWNKKLNFHFHTFCGASKGFMKAFEAPQSVKIKIWLKFFFSSGIGTGWVKIKNIVDLRKTFLENQAACSCTTVRKYFTQQMSIIRFSTLTYCLSSLENRKSCITFQIPFTRKRGRPKIYFYIWTIKKRFLQY